MNEDELQLIASYLPETDATKVLRRKVSAALIAIEGLEALHGDACDRQSRKLVDQCDELSRHITEEMSYEILTGVMKLWK